MSSRSGGDASKNVDSAVGITCGRHAGYLATESPRQCGYCYGLDLTAPRGPAARLWVRRTVEAEVTALRSRERANEKTDGSIPAASPRATAPRRPNLPRCDVPHIVVGRDRR